MSDTFQILDGICELILSIRHRRTRGRLEIVINLTYLSLPTYLL